MRAIRLFLVAVVAVACNAQTYAVDVPAISNILLAGASAGTLTRQGDSAPLNAPVLINLPLIANQSVTVQATGRISDPSNGGSLFSPNGPDPQTQFGPWRTDSEFGISSIYGPMNSLVGVFVGDSIDKTATPPELDFSGEAKNLATLSPMLQQVFFIGDGSTPAGAPKKFNVPLGATRLYLGVLSGSTRRLTGSYRATVSTANVRGYFAQVADGNTWKTAFTLLNTGSTPADYRLRLYQDDGTDLLLPLAAGSSPLAGNIPVGGSVVIESFGQGDRLLQGWAELSGSANLAGHAVYTQRIGTNAAFESVVPLATSQTRLLVPFTNGNGFITGLALLNPEMAQQTIRLTFKDSNGMEIGSGTVTLAPNAHTAFALGTAASPGGQINAGRGVIEISSEKGTLRTAAMGLRFNPTGPFTTIPTATPE